MADVHEDTEQELAELGVPESPATWENEAVGKAHELLGKVSGDKKLEESGAEQNEIAHEVRAEYRREHPS